jgi:hypothetical protein
MKHSLYLTILALTISGAAAQRTVVEAGPHHRRVEQVVAEQLESGEVVAITNSLVELGNGLYRWDAATQLWVEASEEIEIVNGSGVARKTQHQAIFAGDITDEDGVLDMLLPDGETRLVMQPLGIAYTDGTGASVFIAEVVSTEGIQTDRNVIVYPDCFDFVRADVRFTVMLDGLEQDIILREQPPGPAEFGLDEATAKLEVWTQVVNGAQPVRKVSRQVEKSKGKMGTDEIIDFGSMHFPLGRAFNLGQSEGRSVLKEWVEIPEQGTFLIEMLDFVDVKEDLLSLPEPMAARAIDKAKLKAVAGQGKKRGKPASLAQSRTKPKGKAVASIGKGTMQPAPGYVFDYVTRSSGASNFTFQGTQVYHVVSDCTFTGTTTVEAGSVIKFTTNNIAKVRVEGPLAWEGAPYAPVVITGADDGSVGEVVTSNPFTNTYASIALELDPGTNAISYNIENVRISRAAKGIVFKGGSGHVVKHAQFNQCGIAIEGDGTSFSLRNALVVGADKVFSGLNTVSASVEHLTVNGANHFNYNGTIGTLAVTNSLLVAASPTQNFTSNQVVNLASATGVFTGVGKGEHYLPLTSPYRDYGVTNVQLLAELRALTTEAPSVLGADITTHTILSRRGISICRTLDTITRRSTGWAEGST